MPIGMPSVSVGLAVDIVKPEDKIIELTDEPLTFTCKTTPPGHEDKVVWSLAGEQFATETQGRGKTFTTTFLQTGVKQIVARIGLEPHNLVSVTGPDGSDDEREVEIDPPPSLAADQDDVILYVYKTKNKKGRLRDVLDSEPPSPQHVRGYTRSAKRGGGTMSW